MPKELTRWQKTTECRCMSFGCAQTPVGYRTLKKPRARQHLLADQNKLASERTQRLERQRSLEDVPAAGTQANMADGYADGQDQQDVGADDEDMDDEGALGAGDHGSPFSDHENTYGDPPDPFFLPEYSPPPVSDSDNPHPDAGHSDPVRQSSQPAPSPGRPADPEVGEEPEDVVLQDYVDESTVTLCPAVDETPEVRLLYLQVVLGNVFQGATVQQSEQRLNDGLDIIEICNGALPRYPKPARSLATAKRRLGLDVDTYLTKRPICSVCFKFYSFDAISVLDSPACLVRNCKGLVYHLVVDSAGNETRKPAKIHTYVSLLKSLQRFLLRPDFVKSFRLPSALAERAPLQAHEYMHDFHDGAAYGRTEVALQRLRLEDGTIADVNAHRGPRRTLMSVDIGCSMSINVDWFGIIKGRHHSTGGMYITFNNLDRSVRYLKHNVHLAMNIPGPKEPSLEQLNHMIEPLYDELKILHEGIQLPVHGRKDPAGLFGAVEMRSCDLPGSRKFEAFAAHNHKYNPCFFCHIVYEEINSPAAFDVENFSLRDEWEQLKAAFESRDAKTAKAKKDIFDEFGQRWSIFSQLPGWNMSGCAIDFMHNFYLGIAKDMFFSILVDGYLLDKAMWQKVQDTVNAIRWPSGIGRLPTNLADHRNFAKADQWRRWVNIQPTILWIVWRDENDRIRSDAPDVPGNASKQPTFVRNLQEVYEVVLCASIAERILASKSISMDDVQRGHRYLRQCCEEMLRLGIHMLPNHHLAMHYPEIYRLFGPVYAWWLYAYERFNGMQEKVPHNGKADGEMELTLTRIWVLQQRLFELLSSFPADAHPKERALLTRILSENKRAAGTLRAHMSAPSGSLMVPRRIKKPTDLRKLPHSNMYPLLLDFLHAIFPDLHIANELNQDPAFVTFSSRRSVKVFPMVINNGTRFGSLVDKRSDADRVGCVDFADSRIPCQILYHFELTLKGCEPILCSVVQRMCADDDIPSFPWSLYSTDLGEYVAYADQYQELEVVYTTQLSSPVAIIPFTSKRLGRNVPLWAVHSFDRTGIEYEDGWFNQVQAELQAYTDDDVPS